MNLALLILKKLQIQRTVFALMGGILLLLLAGCTPLAPAPPREAILLPPDAPRAVVSYDNMDPALQAQVQSALNQRADQWNAHIDSPKIIAYAPGRSVLVQGWMMVVAARTMDMSANPLPFHPATQSWVEVVYLAQTEDGSWSAQPVASVPAPIQTLLWGAERLQCSSRVCLLYYDFDAPYVAQALRGLDGFVVRTAADLGVLQELTPTTLVRVAPDGTTLAATEDAPTVSSPLTLDIYLDKLAQTTDMEGELGRLLRRSLTNHLAQRLATQALGQELAEISQPRAAAALVQWESVKQNGQWDRAEALIHLERSPESAPLSQLLAPQITRPFAANPYHWFLFYDFVEETFDHTTLGQLLPSFYTSPDWQAVVKEVFQTQPATLEKLWVNWLAQARQADYYQAKIALAAFFQLLTQERYAEAAELYGGDYTDLQAWNPETAPDQKALLWSQTCLGGNLSCLPVLEISPAGQPQPDQFLFGVVFRSSLDSTDSTMYFQESAENPTQFIFGYTVVKQDGRFLVLNLPPQP